ncbi:polymorphic toxin-type HINT domain-containing protein [Massilia sp. CFBP9012]|uniref:polymorphic toxin-type HINT domain-containing protein n=1 Tax=Massilia sp. CFBP9012 TaxID=3096531 RepID=UPI002A6A1CEC|nr:polymorphic toxin-type HINT domain-containing protein [Massilia sp. CFBP9012]MDY0977221.1 polymorphic toxin-type HINT domain-containing protein [Massilia sp. CFBP9012]
MLGKMRLALGRCVLLFIVAVMLCVAPVGAALGQIPLPGNGGGGGMTPVPPGSGGGIKLICDMPGTCPTKQAREEYAKKNNCQFPEDVCEKPSADDDHKGANERDKGFWGSLWDSVKGSVTYGYEFVKGVVAGLKGQIADLWNMVTNPGEVISGLVELGKSFFNDPKGTMQALGQMLGQEAVDTFTRATQCGAYDLGKVIGSYVSPAFGLKLATNLTKFSGKLGDAAKALRKEYGCASFVAGTLVLTAEGFKSIESIVVGQHVGSRNENSFADRPQVVTDVFGRVAPSYRRLATQLETFEITEEHPLWQQGKGWVEAGKLVPGDVIASAQGDTVVVANDIVQHPRKVYNFSVAHTHSYFVGAQQIWVHNAGPCSIELHTKAWDKLSPKEKGYRGEREVFIDLLAKGYEPVGKSFDPRGMSPDDAFKAWDGQTGIDGIYKDKNGNYVIIESKATGGTKKADPEGCVDRLCTVKSGARQMSNEWLQDRIDGLIDDPAEAQKIKNLVAANRVKKVYALTDEKGTSYNEITNNGNRDVEIGKKWNP